MKGMSEEDAGDAPEVEVLKRCSSRFSSQSASASVLGNTWVMLNWEDFCRPSPTQIFWRGW